jgi:hypothetical protein
MRQKLSSPKVIVLIGVIVAGLLGAFGWFALVSPQKSKSTDLTSQISDVQAQIRVTRITARSNGRAVKSTDEKLQALAVAMPDQIAMPGVLRQLLRNARLADVSLDSVKPAPATLLNGYIAVPMDVTVTGRYFNVARYLKRLRLQAGAVGEHVYAAGRLFDIAIVEYTSTPTDLPKITANLHINAFVYSGSAPVAAPVATPPTDTASSSESASAAGRMP